MLNYSCPVVSCRLLLSKMKDLVPKKEKQFMEGMLGVVCCCTGVLDKNMLRI